MGALFVGPFQIYGNSTFALRIALINVSVFFRTEEMR